MAKYTMELRELFTPLRFNPPLFTREEVESWFSNYNLSDYLTSEEQQTILEKGIWSKEKLAKMIVDHYYLREIGFETPMMFKHYAEVEMSELMEEFLPLIYSASIKYDPLENVNFTETFNRTTDTTGESSSESVSNGSSLGVNSDTPQGQISKSAILNGAYASSTGATESDTTINDSTDTSSNTKENYTKNIRGNNGATITNQKLILQYRQNIISINRDIIKRLNILFMGLY